MVEYYESKISVSGESNEKMLGRYASDSHSDDASSRGNAGANARLKKGPWTSNEDAILRDYVTKNGEGNWNAVQKHTGLARCGKSCRLRWANHLRPELKKGPFSKEEENLIIALHAKMGNKWARMATELPGRTDNEIKNFWNTRIKRRQRAGLPIYPPEICQQALNENQRRDDTCAFSSGDVHYPDFIPINNIEIPSVEFKKLELNRQVYSPPFHDIPGSLLDVPANTLLGQGFHSSYSNKPLHSTMYPSSKRFRGSQSFYPGACQSPNVSYMPNAQSLMYASTYDHNLASYQAPPSCVIDGNQYKTAVLNGNPSSEPHGTMKMELPSNQTRVDNWGSPPSPLPPLESVDTLIQTPPIEHTQLCHVSPQNNGLLDAVLHESQALRNPRKSSQVIRETQWDSYWELTSPLAHSSFSEDTTPIGGNAFDEPEAIDPIPGFRVKEEATTWVDPMRYEDRVELTKMLGRPDLLLAHDSWKKRARQEPWPYA